MGKQRTYYLADAEGNILCKTNAISSNEAKKVVQNLSKEDKRKWHAGNCKIGLLEHYERKWGRKPELDATESTSAYHPRTKVKMPRPVVKFSGGEIFPEMTYRVQFAKAPPKGLVRSTIEWGLDTVTKIGSRIINRFLD